MIRKYLFLYIILILLPFSSFAQNSGYVKFTGQVKLRGSNNALNGVDVVFFSEGDRVKELKANSSENFQVMLDFNKNYLVEVNKSGLVKLKFEFDTHIPPAEMNKIHPVFYRIYLFPDYPGIDTDLYAMANSIIKFDETTSKFLVESLADETTKNKLTASDQAILNMTKEKLQIYEDARKEGDRAYDERLFQAALKEYQRAQDLFPAEAASYYVDNKYIEDRIRICKKTVAEAAQNQTEYNQTLEVADKLFEAKEYDRAKVSYQKALSLRPGATKPTERLKEIAKINADNKVHNVLYDVAIESARKWYEAKDYEKALADFEQASQIKPGEEFPKRKINELKKIIDERTAKQESYDNLIASADKKFELKNYIDAKTDYTSALKIFPDEKYPVNRINDIDLILKELDNQSEQKRKYDALVADADALFGDKKYEDARSKYREAVKLRPAEDYPQKKINEINDIIAKALAAQKAYDEAVKRADSLFAKTEYENAKQNYKLALDHKPGEKYPEQRIKEIDNIIAEQVIKLANEKKYQEAIEIADSKFELKEYEESRKKYVEAASIKPEEKYPGQRISEIDKILAEIKSAENYTAAVAAGDEHFEAKDYIKAKESYTLASEIKPEEKYPKERLAEIAGLLAEMQAIDDAYNKAVADGDENLNGEKYEESKEFFKEAQKLKPGEKYPAQKIEEINKILADIEALEKAYAEAIAQGDKNFKSKDYIKAKEKYLEATELKSDQTYTKEKLREIEEILAKERSVQESYDNAIAQADKYFSSKEYENAKTEYQNALTYKPQEDYPEEKITEIEKILADIKANNEAYDKAIAIGDEKFTLKEYLKSKDAYNEALGIKPGETYPKEKIAEIDNILADAKAKQIAYDDAIAAGDSQLNVKDYSKAKESYSKASEIKPGESYPKEKINEIDALLAEILAADEAYTKAIAEADEKFNSKLYEESKKSYQEASKIKPGESYPKERIAEIDKIIADIAAKEEAYAEAISKADKGLAAKDYENAKSDYKKASEIKPSEEYPKEKIAEIEKILAEARSLQESYDNAIAQADKYFSSKEYENARTEYQNALTFKPEENYPKQKITEIEKILADIKAKNEAYEKAIAVGDEKFTLKEYLKSKEAYNEALGIKPDETYPNEKIAEIDNILADAKAKQKAYDDAIAAGDSQFNSKDYSKAKESYSKASEIKPEQNYPKEKIKEIDSILAEQLAKDEAYKKAIAEADSKFTAKDYENSKTSYEEAQKIKPKETYPSERIAEIEKILADIKAKRNKYDELIVKADEAYSIKEYNAALTSYKDASAILENEEYPKTKIKEIETLLAEIKEKEEAYKNSIASADQKFSAKQYAEAKTDYQKALEAKPVEQYPKDKINEIDGILAEIKRVNDAFDNAVSSGESYFKMKEYEDALKKYKEADEIKPGEQFVKDKIIEINNILLADQKARQEAYDKAIAAADGYYTSKEYKNAIKEYENASNIKTEEEYPKRKIAEINTILEEQRRLLQEQYDKVIAEADRLFGTRIFDQAIAKYKEAMQILPDEKYPRQKINEITQYIIDHAIVDVNKETMVITEKSEKKFSFEPVDIRARKNAYIFLKIKNLSDKQFKLFLNYGRDAAKSGGVTFDLEKDDTTTDYIIRVSVQDRWYRIDNNWLSLYPQGGDIEISSIRISKGE